MGLYDSKHYLEDLSNAILSVKGLDVLKGKSILITGASGLIGSFVVDMLLQYNKNGGDVDIFAVGRNVNRLKQRFSDAISDKLHFVEHDVNTKPSFDFSVDFVIHAASNAYPAAFANDPVGTILNNVQGTHYLLEYAKNHGTKRFLFVSSGEVYGIGESGIKAFVEDYSGYVDIVNPRSCYPSSKRTAETLCASFSKQFGLDTVIVRPCHIYGACTTQSDNRASVQFARNALAGEDIKMQSRGTQMRSYCYIADCASALLTVLCKGNSGEAYNISNMNSIVTIAGLAEEIAACVGKKVIYPTQEETPTDQQTPITYAVLDSSKLSSLGWQGKYDINQGVNQMMKILKEITD